MRVIDLAERVTLPAVDELERSERDLSRAVGRCIGDFELIREGDRVMACLSGGKDSYTMLHLLERLRERAGEPVEGFVGASAPMREVRTSILSESAPTFPFTWAVALPHCASSMNFMSPEKSPDADTGKSRV